VHEPKRSPNNRMQPTALDAPRLIRHVSQMRMNQRVTIRPYEDTDASEMSVAARESVAEVSPWMPWCHSEYSVADAAAWVRTTRGGHADGSMYDFAIIDANGSYAGGCGVNHINRMDRFANLGYWVRTSLAGRGIAPAAVLQLISWTFANTTLNGWRSLLPWTMLGASALPKRWVLTATPCSRSG
jgi:RimJ/RimL family protein N-acetyltransferase